MALLYQVDKCEFREMVQALYSRYQLPHKDYLSRVASPQLYAEVHTGVKKLTEDSFFLSINSWFAVFQNHAISELYRQSIT